MYKKDMQNIKSHRVLETRDCAFLKSQFLTKRQRPTLIIVHACDVTDDPLVFIRCMCKSGT